MTRSLAALVLSVALAGLAAPSVAAEPPGRPATPTRAAAHPGTRDDDTVAPRSYRGLPALDRTARARAPRQVRVLVLRMYWSAQPPKYPDTPQMKQLMRDTASWFKRASRGRHRVNSLVTPWLRVGGAAANCVEQSGSVNRALAAARGHGIGTGGFNRLMLVMPQCGTNSLGEMPGRVTWIREKLTHLDVLTHELGHNLGLNHANSLICSADKRRVTQGGGCFAEEYGDLWDAMGISTRPYSVAVLQRLGWAGKVVTATKSGTWTLRDAEASGSGIQGLRVKVSGRVSYWLEYHTTDVASQKEPGSFEITGTPGLQVRLDTGRASLQILDAAPGNPDNFLSFPDPDLVNATLPPGSSFTTPQRVRITLLSQDATSATVRVTRGQAAAAPDAPTLVSAVRDQASGGVELTVQPPPSDHGQVVLGYLAQRTPGGKAVYLADPGGTHTHFSVDDFHHGPGTWTVRAVNQVGSSPASPGVAEHLSAPVVAVTSPTAGAQVPGPTVTVTVSVTPDALTQAPIQQVTVCLLTGGDCATDTTAPYAVTLTAFSGPDGVRATATDANGGQGISPVVPVTVVDSPPSVHLDTPLDGMPVTTGDVVDVAATATANPATQQPVSYVTFTLYSLATGQVVDSDVDSDAPFTGQLYVPEAGDYRVEAVATDDYYSSPPSSVTIHATDPPPLGATPPTRAGDVMAGRG